MSSAAPDRTADPAPEPSATPALPTADEAIALARRWAEEGARAKPDSNAERLAGVLKDPVGLDFTLGFVDRVMRPEDRRVAARNLEALARRIPRFLPWHLRAAIAAGGAFARLLPWPIIPISRRVLRAMVSHLVIDATPTSLDRHFRRLRVDGTRLNINLLGEAVLGDAEADRRLQGTLDLLGRDDVDYVSVKVSSVTSQLSMWGFDETVARVVARLTPLYGAAVRSPSPKFINLDMEEYRDLDLTIAVFTALLEKPGLAHLEAGIVLQAYLPDSLAALQRLTAWARARVAAGGAPIKVRVVKGANLAMERVDAALHDWPLATWPTKQATDTHYKRMLAYALQPENAAAVKIGVAGHNLFDLAWAQLLATRRGVADRVDIEMLLGMAPGQADAVKRDTGGLLLYTPVVAPAEFDAAISYLVRRLEENASDENFMSAVFDLAPGADGASSGAFAREAERFRASLADVDARIPGPNRTQDREHPHVPAAPLHFENDADTDPALPANRRWAAGILARSRETALGVSTIRGARVASPEALQRMLDAVRAAGVAWGARPAAERAVLLDRIGEVLEAMRGRLIEVMAAETGKTVAEADVEVSEAVDFARWYADRARHLDAVPGARFVPARVTVATPPWNFPVSIPCGSVLAPLAAGSAVIFKPAPQAKRSGAVLAEALWEAGAPRDLVALVDVDEGELGRALVTAPEVDRVILTGSIETAALFRSWKPELALLAETSGKNAIVVTPSADLDLAVNDLVKSAFGNAGQKCSAASLGILVGSVADSERFRRQLVDAVTSLRVGWPQDPTVAVGPVIEPAAGKLLRGLTVLGEGESWLVEPRRLDADHPGGGGRLWSPGVRAGVRPGSEFHTTEYFGPVLGLLRADSLEEALELQNATAYGLTAGIHSLDPEEVAYWIDSVQAGNLYVNRGITGAIVRRQPFGGWKRSSVGPGAKAGGPNTLLALGSWEPVAEPASGELHLDGIDDRVRAAVEALQPGLDHAGFEFVRQGAYRDQEAWEAEFGVSRDVSALGVERNVFRYRPAAATIRLAEGGSLAEFARVLAAAVRAGARVELSSALPLPASLRPLVSGPAPLLPVGAAVIEGDALFAARAAARTPERIRMIGGSGDDLARALGGAPDVAIWAGPVTTAGRIEMLPFLREQAVAVTAHRFGNPDRAMAALPI